MNQIVFNYLHVKLCGFLCKWNHHFLTNSATVQEIKKLYIRFMEHLVLQQSVQSYVFSVIGNCTRKLSFHHTIHMAKSAAQNRVAKTSAFLSLCLKTVSTRDLPGKILRSKLFWPVSLLWYSYRHDVSPWSESECRHEMQTSSVLGGHKSILWNVYYKICLTSN